MERLRKRQFKFSTWYLLLGFVIPNVSIGGHLGGLIGGGIAAFAMDKLGDRRRGVALPVAACVAVGLVAAVAGVAVSGRGLPAGL